MWHSGRGRLSASSTPRTGAPQWPGAEGCGACGRLGLSGATPGTTAPRHQARRRGPVPTGPLRRDSRRHRPEPQMGGRPAPTCRTGQGTRRTAFATRAQRPPHRRLGHQRTHGAPTTRPAPRPERAIQAHKNAGARTLGGLVHHCDHRSKPPAPPPTPGDSSKREPGAFPEAVGSSYTGTTAQAPGKPPASAGPAVARRPPGRGRADPGNRDRQTGGAGTNRTRPHPTHDRRTPQQSQPHHHPPYNQPPTEPRTIQGRTGHPSVFVESHMNLLQETRRLEQPNERLCHRLGDHPRPAPR